MARANMNELLRKRMTATQQASEQQAGDAAYEQIFQMPAPQTGTQFCDVPIDKLRPFFTADIGFHSYPQEKLEAFAVELQENGLYERILVRPVAGTDTFEILAGHNRTAAAKLAGWERIPAAVMTVNDQRAISIAIATNLLRRQDLTIIERGWDNLSPEELEAALNEKVAEGMINISMNTAPYFENGSADGNLMIVNESINNYPQKIQIGRNDTGEQIYESGAIAVGSKIDRAKLGAELVKEKPEKNA